MFRSKIRPRLDSVTPLHDTHPASADGDGRFFKSSPEASLYSSSTISVYRPSLADGGTETSHMLSLTVGRFDHLHLSRSGGEELSPLKTEWLNTVLASDYREFQKAEMQPFEQVAGQCILPIKFDERDSDNCSHLLLLSVVDYRELVKPSGSTRSFSFDVSGISFHGCKFSVKKPAVSEAFLIKSSQAAFDIKISVHAKSKSSTGEKLLGALKISRQKARSAFGSIRRKRAPEHLMGVLGNISNATICGGASEPTIGGHGHVQEKVELVAHHSLRHELRETSYRLYHLNLTKPDSSGTITAELVLGIGTFISKASVPEEPPIAEIFPAVSFNGYLTVQMHNVPPKIPVWFRYWAVLQGLHIIFYDFMYKETKPALFIMDVKNIVRVKLAEPERVLQSHSFITVSETGTRTNMFADSDSAMKEWIKNLDSAISRYRPSGH